MEPQANATTNGIKTSRVGKRPIDLPKGCYLFGRCPSQVERCRDTPQHLATLPDAREVRCWRVEAGEI